MFTHLHCARRALLGILACLLGGMFLFSNPVLAQSANNTDVSFLSRIVASLQTLVDGMAQKVASYRTRQLGQAGGGAIFPPAAVAPNPNWTNDLAAVNNLQPGQWYEVQNSKMSVLDPCPARNCSYSSVQGQKAIMNAWGGGAYDWVHDKLLIHGGGHNDYFGNEVYGFNTNLMQWERLTNPSLLANGTSTYGAEWFADGTPGVNHTYDRLEYIPEINSFCRFGGGYGNKGSACMRMDTFAWSQAPNVDGEPTGIKTGYDPVTHSVWFRPGGAHTYFYRYDSPTNTFVKNGSLEGGWATYRSTGALDSVRRLFVTVGGGEVRIWDVSSNPVNRGKAITTTGDTAIIHTMNPGLEYDPVIGKIVAWAGGTDVYTLDTATWVWTKVPLSPSNTVIPTPPQANGTYGRFRYVPSKNVYIAVNDVAQNVFFFRLSAGTGATPSCSDGIDNDGDSFIDYPNDTGCLSANDTDEYDPPAPDTQAPTVSLTAPTQGSTVSGVITLSASASDNIGIAGVQFLVDGANAGAEDTTTPHSITLDTAAYSNGTHSLTARARDAAGNTALSPAVSVTVSNAPLPPAVPILHLKFDETSGTTASDSSGNGNTGTLVNGSTWSPGITGGAVSLDGANDYVNLNQDNFFDLTGDMTMTAWINKRSNSGADGIFGKGGCYNAACPFNFRTTGAGTFGFDQNNGTSGQDTLFTTVATPLNTWAHVAFVRSGNTRSIYVNGVLAAGPTVYTRTPTANSQTATIGTASAVNPVDSPFDGLIDDLRVYNRALNTQEVAEVYADI